MRICVILNPAARGARRLGSSLPWEDLAPRPVVWRTSEPGDGRRLAAEAVRKGFELLVAAGGDGTVNEVLNGMGDVPGAWEQVRLAVLPLGTANVWARELSMLEPVRKIWQRITSGAERILDVPWAEWEGASTACRRYFVQLAGVGWDAQAIERVRPGLKRWLGPWAYVWAGWLALQHRGPAVRWQSGMETARADWVLVGNGRLYGGPFAFFPDAVPDDGELDICFVPYLTVTRAVVGGLYVLWTRRLPEHWVTRRRSRSFRLTADEHVPFEVDGEWVGRTPVVFGLLRRALRVAA
ncbi:MAG: diacylglycerol kinase family protein [Verrucomicrobiota bacterium]|nr:hypothetical protein [Limisphaera sp.]MDW8381244.1 diacylglycerol kinase family protein [Verrucomicrobiota bacterium]